MQNERKQCLRTDAWGAWLFALAVACQQTTPAESPKAAAPNGAEPLAPAGAQSQVGQPLPTAPSPAPPVSSLKRDAHGALVMDNQVDLMTRIAYKGELTDVPVGVNPGIWQGLMPTGNELHPDRVELGRKLYFDVRLSTDQTVACATCHDVSRGFTDRRPVSEGVGGKLGRRNAPTTMNAVFFQTQFWDGRAASLEEQALLPIINPIEMGHSGHDTAVAAIASDAQYQALFQKAYGRKVNHEDIGRALASFERTLIYLDAPFDRFVSGQANAISNDAKAGWVLFNGKARCSTCHQFNGVSPIGTNNKFHNIGVSARVQNFEKLAQQALVELAKDASAATIDRLALETDLSELGRFVVTRNRSDIGAFKTQQLRNVGITGPYMHDGSLSTLWDVMDHYNKGGEPNPYLDGGIEPLNLSEEEIDQLVAFMFALTDVRFADDNRQEQDRQRGIARARRPFRDEALATRRVLQFQTRAAKAAQ